MARIEIPTFKDKGDIFGFLVENKALHYKQKFSEDKKADALSHAYPREANKAGLVGLEDINQIRVKSVINTTNLMDSHADVHIPKIWNKNLKENKSFLLLQEHVMNFKNVISDEVKAYVETMSFKGLGFPQLKGDTQALIFDSLISKDRNEFMFNQYGKGFVKNHSVGMRYVKLFLAVNSDSIEYKEENEVWNKYFSEVANTKDAEEQGYFWAVTEAKIIEGSAVVKGSNVATPTQSVESKDFEPPAGTQETEPPLSTQKNTSHLGQSIFY
jgi:hypothetical protein